MLDPALHAIILAGGSGTRLWPLSRTLLPKQLLSMDGGRQSLLKYTATRILDLFAPEHVHTVTNDEQVFEVRRQLREVDPALEDGVLAEPVKRNTLPAIMLALDRIVAVDPEAVVAVFPADQQIEANGSFAGTLAAALPPARQGRLVTFGIVPTKPETGYGYIHKGRALGEGAFDVTGFVEKPDLATATRFVEGGEAYWNSGMLVFTAAVFLEAVRTYQPVFWDWWEERAHTPLVDGYVHLPDISVDYAIVEPCPNRAMVVADFAWDDLGNWNAVYRIGAKDAEGNAVQGDVLALDCHDNLLISPDAKLACVGLDNMIVVQTRDATLVCPRDDCQQVKDVVAALKAQGSPLVEAHRTVHRPWGEYTVLEEGPRYKIKRIELPPGGQLSLQMHHHRSEHWVVISGAARIRLGDEDILLTENQSADIPMATLHRLANPGKVPLVIIEIQTGTYLEEDDIVRFSDAYGRQ